MENAFFLTAFAVLCLTIEVYMSTIDCPVCIPRIKVNVYRTICSKTPLCKRGKRRSSGCPPCIPIDKISMYKNQCLDKSICTKKSADHNVVKRSASSPPCIPLRHSKAVCTPVK